MIPHIGEAMDADAVLLGGVLQKLLDPLFVAKHRPLPSGTLGTENQMNRPAGVERARDLAFALAKAPAVRGGVRKFELRKERKLLQPRKGSIKWLLLRGY